MSNIQHFRQTKELTPEVFEKLMKSKEETAHLTIRNIHCPFCGYLVEKVFSDVAGHKQVYCKKCKEEYIINLSYFRRRQPKKFLEFFYLIATRKK